MPHADVVGGDLRTKRSDVGSACRPVRDIGDRGVLLGRTEPVRVRSKTTASSAFRPFMMSNPEVRSGSNCRVRVRPWPAPGHRLRTIPTARAVRGRGTHPAIRLGRQAHRSAAGARRGLPQEALRSASMTGARRCSRGGDDRDPSPYETLWKAPRTLDAAVGVDLTWTRREGLGSKAQ